MFDRIVSGVHMRGNPRLILAAVILTASVSAAELAWHSEQTSADSSEPPPAPGASALGPRPALPIRLPSETEWQKILADLPKPGANRADEPVAAHFSLASALRFLDATALHWQRERKCGSCHTNYPYLMARAMTAGDDCQPLHIAWSFFADRAAHWETAKPRWDTEVVATACALAFYDAHRTGTLHPLTRKALDWMWRLQRPDGSWDWLKCDWPPSEADDYYGIMTALLAAGLAPDRYKETQQARAGVAKIRAYIAQHPAPHLHHRLFLLWNATLWADLMTDEEKQALVRQVLHLQKEDGSWCLPALGSWKRHDGTANDTRAPGDGYATGLVAYVLRQSGLAPEHPALRRAVHWLRTQQRQSGRWFTRSLSNDRHHYLTHVGSAYAIMALASCNALEDR